MPSYTFPATTTQPPQATDDGSPMRSIADGAAFEWYLPLSAGRAEVERHIAEAFQRAYGAMVTTFCPTLLALRRAGQLCAAVGLRPALEPLFLESYLSAPVQQVLGSRVDAPVRRSQLAEIGNLVSNGGASPLLLLLLTAAAERAGFEWLV
ncbi:MAG TPA: thermostable hemolysin, partial [Spongiibacteraceae bacterium]|nr:thermostable hemolysin [Spongiibacteraceae bacterium]